MKEINPKQFPSEVAVVRRSQLYLCDYNPRQISEEGRKALKRSLKKFGVLGGIVVNRRNSPAFASQPKNMVASGNQKVAVLDLVNKYDPQDPETDYELRAELIDVDPKTEKELVVAMNNQNIGGQWDYDLLRELIPEIDYKEVGFTEADLSIIGVDYLFQSQGEASMADALADLMQPADDEHRQELDYRRMERESAKLQQQQMASDLEPDPAPAARPELTYEERKQQMKDLKQEVRDKAIERASNMDAYFTVSFDTWRAKAEFMSLWGYDPNDRFIKGEDFLQRLEGFADEEE